MVFSSAVLLWSLAQQLLQCALIGGRAHQLTVHIQTVRLGDQTDLLGQVLLQRRLVYHVLPQQQAGGILQQGVVDGVALPQRPAVTASRSDAASSAADWEPTAAITSPSYKTVVPKV